MMVENEKEKSWGYELIIDALCENSLKFEDKEYNQRFIDELVDSIHMEKYGPMIFEIFAQHDETKAGPTLVQLISTSNIIMHSVPFTRKIFFNCFSCKEFDVDTVIDIFEKYFPTIKMCHKLIKRNI